MKSQAAYIVMIKKQNDRDVYFKSSDDANQKGKIANYGIISWLKVKNI